jgi:hypothetical protein
MLESNQANAFFGKSVSTAGDVNGDGYSDVVVGAWLYDNGQTDEGAVFVYLGSSGGVSSTASAILECNQANAHLGNSVSSAGDVNGDGYSDIISGANLYDNGQTDEGASFLYHGSSSGIITTAAAILECNQASANFGVSVAQAGDVNGDGYSDVIVGAYAYTNGSSSEGAAFIYQGNNGGGLRRNLKLFNASGTVPIQQSNYTLGNFGIGLFAKNPDGKSKGHLVWEVKSEGQAFSNNPITNSTQFTAQQGSFTNLGIAGVQLTSNVNKPGFETKLRVRIKYDLVTSINGEVYSPWIYTQGSFGSRGMGSAPLPIKLVNFNATAIDNKYVDLVWQTASEKNNAYFSIERSVDNKKWETVARIDGAGNSTSLLSYGMIDKSPFPGISYYRLRQTDYNNKFSYSAIRCVNIPEEGKTSTLVYPNPSAGQLYIQTDNTEIGNIKIYNMLGENITNSIAIVIKNGVVVMDLASLPKGYYYVSTGGVVNKIFKQ